VGGVGKKLEPLRGILLALVLLGSVSCVFVTARLNAQRQILHAIEDESVRYLALQEEQEAFVRSAELRLKGKHGLYRPFADVGEAFETLSGLLKESGLRHQSIRHIDPDGAVYSFEIMGRDGYMGLLSFFDLLIAAERPIGLTSVVIDGAPGDTVSYRVTVDVLVAEGGE
jgi:hypothetical protein